MPQLFASRHPNTCRSHVFCLSFPWVQQPAWHAGPLWWGRVMLGALLEKHTVQKCQGFKGCLAADGGFVLPPSRLSALALSPSWM